MHTIARRLSVFLAAVSACALVSVAEAQDPTPAISDPGAAGEAAEQAAAPQTQSPAPAEAPDKTAVGPVEAASPLAQMVKDKLAATQQGGDEQAAKELAAMTAFYEARAFTPVWVSETGLLPRRRTLLRPSRMRMPTAWRHPIFRCPRSTG